MNKKNNNKGFTLAELLIVVAIIAVLVAIAIPVFTTQLEKSREATDLANVRSAYAEVTVAAIEDAQTGSTKTISIRQQQDDWQTAGAQDTLVSIFGSAAYVEDTPKKGCNATVAWVAGSTGSDAGHAKVTFAQS